ncbi:hypothetical protein THRCLA_06800 [Thraustotheca clavata]|uniref:Uncharacterized protein n=1 Tax=Thraustotheca clavata TaxID=74557 RepID=A0A1V9ZJ39_9STRA|nr:hypothetical protein THRCLA_06800 [Thraustotheca clavata]
MILLLVLVNAVPNLCPKGSYFNSTVASCVLCPAGTFGSMPGLTTCHCSGLCTAGFFCPMGSTISTQQMCGGPNYFCPKGTSSRIVVSVGYYTVSSSDPGTGLDDSVEYGIAARANAQFICDPGYYCNRGIRYACPAGTYGNNTGLTTATCTSICPPGFYCPLASILPLACPPGVYGATTGLATPKCSGLCPIANYCLLNTVIPEPCPAGLLGNYTGLTTKACSPTCTLSSCLPSHCPPGYFCPLGSTMPQPCGGVGVYCPVGSSVPTPVTTGYYTIATPALSSIDSNNYIPGGNGMSSGLTIRISQAICAKGTFCVNGQKFLCPPGTYGDTLGLSTPMCSGACPQGFFCPQGSTGYSANACVEPSSYCPGNTAAPIAVTTGYFTTLSYDGRLRVEQTICPIGSYCVNGIAHLCPWGSYGAVTGLSSSVCSGNCAPGAICPRGSILASQQLCLGGTYAVNGKQCAPCRPGYWCSSGSSSPIQNECGGTNVFCPLGSASPQPVQNGYYASNPNSLSGANADFTTQTFCSLQNFFLLPQCSSITIGTNSSF